MRNPIVFRIDTLVVSVLAAWLAAGPLTGQTVSAGPGSQGTGQKDTGQTWTPPRTAWGDPDLQGVWSYASLTPLQRPAKFADKEFFTPEQAAARNAAASAERQPVPGSVGSYNALWFDRGSVDPKLRTSLIVDPPNGRLPPLTAEGQARVAAQGPALQRPPRLVVELHCVDSVHHLPWGTAGLDRVQQHVSHPADPELRSDSGRKHSRCAHHSAGWAPAARRAHPPVERGVPGSLGGRDAGCRDGQLQRQDGTSIPFVQEPARSRALHPRG